MNPDYKQNSFKTIKQKYRTYRNKTNVLYCGDFNKPQLLIAQVNNNKII